MSLSTTINKVIHSGNASATVFAYTFPILDASHLSVIYTDADDVETTLSASLYSVTGIGGRTGGSVTYPLSGSPIATGTKLTIVRTVPYTQTTVLSNQGGYYPEVIEARFDYIYMAMQQLAEIVGRYTTSSISDPATEQSNYALIQTLQQMDLLTTRGDLLTRDGSAYKRLARGTTGQVLGVSGSDLAWQGSGIPAPQGRLTLSSGVPVMASDVTAATVVYYAPYCGSMVPIYDGSTMVPTVFTQLSNTTTASSTGKAGPAAVTTNSNYDLFVWNDSGTIRLTRGGAWNSDSARSATTENDLEMVSGILTNKNAITNGPAANRGTYVGTVRSDGSSQLGWSRGGLAAGGSWAWLGVWNAYNRVVVSGLVADSTNSWTYQATTIRAANNSATMRVSFVQGLTEDYFEAGYRALYIDGTSIGYAGIGYNATNAFSGRTAYFPNASASLMAEASHAVQQLGWGYMSACEAGNNGGGTGTWFGDNNIPTYLQTGLAYRGRF